MAQEIADSTLLDTWGSGGNIVEPDISKIIEGWQLGEQPPHEYMNWLQNAFGSKLNHILKNGVASWNNETEYLAGSSVQHNGNVWLCKTTNTNSAPTDVNANWKRIITVESLTTVLGGYVKQSANLSDLANASTARTNLGLGTAATRNVGTAAGNVMEVGAFGLGASPYSTKDHISSTVRFMADGGAGDVANRPLGFGYGSIISVPYSTEYTQSLSLSLNGPLFYTFKAGPEASVKYVELHTTGNILTTTGQSTLYPMTQKAVTDALNAKVGLSENQTIAGVKTFSSSPIVPTPTTGTQVANKAYVDNVATLNINALDEKATPVNTDNLAIQETGGLLKKVSFKNLTKLNPNDARVKTSLNATGDAPIYACRAWVNFDGTGTVAIRASGNVSSITDIAVGNYVVNFTTAMIDANYSAVAATSATPTNHPWVEVSEYNNNNIVIYITRSIAVVNGPDVPHISCSVFR